MRQMKRMNDKWLSLSVYTDKTNQDIIGSYFDLYSIGNHFNGDHITMYFSINNKNKVEGILLGIHEKYEIIYDWSMVESQNWMSNWKNFFKPVNIDDKVLIIPDWDRNIYNLDFIIKICPAMAFGTGHHESTQLMIRHMIDYNIEQYDNLLDLGSGTGILSILAKKMGINNITGIEIDSVCEENFYKNCRLSDVKGIDFKILDVHSHENYNYDVILANIDKKNIVKILNRYQDSDSKAIMILAGLLDSDLNDIKDLITDCYIDSIKQENEWISLVIKKGSFK